MTSPVQQPGALRAEINVTPLVDIVLVLLLIFMVVTPLLREEARVDLPVARTSVPGDATALTLQIAADGSLTLAGEVLPGDHLAERLRTATEGRGERTVVLAADRSLPYATIVAVIDACREAGIGSIGIVTEKAMRPDAPR
jgi:biopolymer transport protein TolR